MTSIPGYRSLRPLTATVLALGLVTALGACSSSGDDAGASPAPGTATTAPGPAASGTPTSSASPGDVAQVGVGVVGIPATWDPAPSGATAGVGWSSDDTHLDVVLFGSSSCPETAVSPATSAGAGKVTVTVAEHASDGPCTANYGPATTVVEVPSEVDATQPLEVTVQGKGGGTVTVPAFGAGVPQWVQGQG